jgi:NAD-dependent deacetylase
MENDSISRLADMIKNAGRVVAFTGAGISTESGIPDFRSPGGIWTKYKPVTYQEFLASNKAREDYWARYTEFFPPFETVKPNAGHLALAELEQQGRLIGIITQNIDRLHQAAGNADENVIELHGRVDITICLSCGLDRPTRDVILGLTSDQPVPQCSCGGWLKPATISFGQELPQEALEQAVQLAANCDLFLAIGSSLTVHPAASLPGLAVERGASLVIVNVTPTPYDHIAQLVVNKPTGQTLSDVIRRLASS